MIQVYGLKKSYGRNKAVDGISFQVKAGEMAAVLGPNGAGKSTTIDILCTCREADHGLIIIDDLILGEDDQKIRKRIGVVFQQGVLDEYLTIEENLTLRGRFYGLRGKKLAAQIKKVAAATGIGDLLKRKYGKLSGGQRRRCDIARALINDPKVLFLDEPTTGLDPQIRVAIWDTIDRIRADQAMTVILTTHYMEEAAGADKIIVMKAGKIEAMGTPAELKAEFSSDRVQMTASEEEALKDILEVHGIKYSIRRKNVCIHISDTMEALRLLDLCRGRFRDFEVIKGSLDEAYRSIIAGQKRRWKGIR